MKGRKVFKQIASIITMVLLLQYVSVLAPLMQVKAETATVDGIDWTYEIDSNGNAINVEPKSTYSISRDVTIPNQIDGHSVISIKNYAFSFCSNLTSVEIPSSVTTIGHYAFYYCSNLTSVKIPSSVTTIGYYAFYNCSSLTSVEILEGVTSIGEGAFDSCSSLTSVKIPGTVATIGDYAFSNCSRLTNIEIPSSVTTIGTKALPSQVTVICDSNSTAYQYAIDNNIKFCGEIYTDENGILWGYDVVNGKAENLQYLSGTLGEIVTTPATINDMKVVSIRDSAFSGCGSLTSIKIPEGVTSIGDYAFKYCSSLTSINIPEGVISIGEGAFYECSNLTSVEMPSSVTSIGDYAFKYCSSLISVKIPSSVTDIGNYAFEKCGSLTSIDVNENNSKYSSIDGVLFNKDKSNLIKYPEGKQGDSYKIPEKVTTIIDSAFYNCSSLTNIEIPSSVTSIEEYAFCGCENLKSIEIPSSVTSIGESAFSECSSLTSVKIPGTVTTIGDYAFEYCSGLTSVEILEGVTSIGESAFSGCSSLTSVKIPGTVTTIGDYAFEYCSGLTSVEILEGVTSIEEGTFYECSSLTSVKIPGTVATIGDYAFSNCSSLTSIKIPSSVTTIGTKALPSQVTVICDANSTAYQYAIDNNIKFCVEIYTDENGILWGYDVVNGKAENLQYLSGTLGEIVTTPATINDMKVVSIGESAFSGCNSLTNIKIPEGVTSIGNSAFSSCGSLTNVEMPSSVTTIGEYAFSGCNSLTDIKIPEGAKSIEKYAFKECSSLTSIEIPKGVTKIGEYAFSGCSGLTTIKFHGTYTKIEAWALPSQVIVICDSNSTAASYAYSYDLKHFEEIYTDENGILWGYDVVNGKAENLQYLSGTLGEIVTIPATVNDREVVSIKKILVSNTVKKLIVSDGITSIGDYAFSGCSSLTSAKIPNSVTNIGNSAFSGCSSLTSIEIPSSVMSIGKSAFERCSSLTSAKIEEGVMSIGDSAFERCSSLTSIEIPSSVTSIGSYAFLQCNNLTNIEIPEGVTGIGKSAFSGCSNLTSITIPEGVTSIGDYAFNRCSSLTSITIPEGVTSIKDYAFEECSSLTSIEIPSSVTSIGYRAFEECSSLTSIEIPSSVTSIEGGAFYKCSSLKSIEIPDSITSIGWNAFYGCTNLVIECEEGSYACQYAKENNIAYDTTRTTVKFKDSKLCEAILKEIQNDEERVPLYDINRNVIKVRKIQEITSLDLSNADISDLTGIDKFTGLKELNLDNNKISDISLLDNMQFDNLTIKNQQIEMPIMKYTSEAPNIIQNAVKDKYSKGESVSLENNNCSVDNGEITVNNDFTTNDTATITVNNGVMSGSVCTIKTEDVKNISVEIPKDTINLKIIPYKNEEKLDIKDIDIYYSVDDGDKSGIYKNEIELSEGNHKINTKFFGADLKSIETTVKVNISAIRKNGKVYIISDSNSEIQYSLTEDGEKEKYTEPFENTEANNLFVKVGENSVKNIQIVNITVDEIYDVKTSKDILYKKKGYEYGAIRKNGIIYLHEFNKKQFEYSFGGDYYKYVDDGTEIVKIENLDADKIYIKDNNGTVSTYQIVDGDKFSEILGIYNNNGNSYIFSQERKNINEKNGENILVINNENKIEKLFSEEILDVTSLAGDVFILKKDGKVYKIGNSYDDLQLVRGSEDENFIQINGIYALSNENKIYKCNYDYNDNTYSYSLCENYTIENKIEKLLYVNVNNEYCPYVLYENGKAVILKNDGTNEMISNNAIDISSDIYSGYALEGDKVIFKGQVGNSEVNLASIISNGENSIKITKEGAILTDKGNYYKPNFKKIVQNECDYLKLSSYSEKPTKTNIAKLGDYTYQDSTGRVYYIENDMEISKQVDNIEVTKNESNLAQNKVSINVKVPENTYTIKLPDGTTSKESNLEYEVTENGVYTFEFTDSTGYSVTRVIHVTNIQSRKETKVPEVTSLNGNIKLESDEKIEYSLDKENWTEYTEKIEYTVPIYARIKSDQYECSILKITLDADGKLNVENTEERQIEDGILTNGMGQMTEDDYKDNIKIIEYEAKVEEKSTETNDKNKNFFDYVSEIADNIIYSFSSTDGQYAGCYFEDDVTETTYKDINNNVSSMQNKELNINDLSNNNNSIDYGIIKKTYKIVWSYETDEAKEKQKKENGEIYSYERYVDKWKETIVKYAYIDNQGNLISNIDIVNKAKDVIGENTKYTKIVGDGGTFYILTQEGEVYAITQDDNGTYNYFAKRLKLINLESIQGYSYEDNVDIVYKLNLRNIIDIYDTCTALTKDGKIVSLLQDNEEDSSVVQELQRQTEKYLISSHLGLKDGKLYNFDYVKEGVEVTAGKIVKTESNDDKKIGIYSENDNKIKLFYMSKIGSINVPELSEGESYISVEPVNEELPEFIDIAEYTESYLTNYVYYYLRISGYTQKPSSYENANEYAMVYALAKDGEIWAYIGDYVVDTGVNLDYFGPTANYRLNNTEFTNKDINLQVTANTTNEIVSMKVKKAEETIDELDKNNGETLKEKTVGITKNGKYEIELTDGKARTYTSTLKVANIDKLAPNTPEIEKTNEKIKVIFKDDKEATEDYAKSGIKERLISYDGTNWNKQEQDTYELEASDNNITIYAKTIDNAGNESEIASTTSERGKVTVKYQDENGNSLKEDLNLTGFVGVDYKVEKAEIDGYKFIEVVGNEAGKYTKEDQTVIYKYEKVKEETIVGKVIVKYQDENGNSLKEDLNLTGKVGDSYKVERQEIDLYELTNVEGNEAGKYTKEDQTVIYKYTRVSGRIIIIHEDPEGNKIQEDTIITGKVGEPYKVERPTVEGYELIEVIGNEEGTYKVEDQFVRYKYKKIEVPALPQTGQGRIVYLILGSIIIICIGTLIYYKKLKHRK